MTNNLTRKQKFILAMTALLGIVLIQSMALLKGIDGQVFSTSLATLAAAMGWFLKSSRTSTGG